MKAETILSNLKHYLRDNGFDNVLEKLEILEKAPEPEYIYRIFHDSPWGKSHPTIGSKHRMRCIVNSRGNYYKEHLRVERSVPAWEDVTRDFIK